MIVKLFESDRKDKKLYVVVNNSKIYFGSSNHSDYTLHKDKERKKRYILRHQKRENWKDYTTAGFWAKWLLWNRTTLDLSIRDVLNRFQIKIIKQF